MKVRVVRSVRPLPSGNVCATVVDEHLRIVRVVVPFRNSDADELRTVIEHTLDLRRPGAPKEAYRNG